MSTYYNDDDLDELQDAWHAKADAAEAANHPVSDEEYQRIWDMIDTGRIGRTLWEQGEGAGLDPVDWLGQDGDELSVEAEQWLSIRWDLCWQAIVLSCRILHIPLTMKDVRGGDSPAWPKIVPQAKGQFVMDQLVDLHTDLETCVEPIQPPALEPVGNWQREGF